MSWGMQAGSTMAVQTIAILGGLHLRREGGCSFAPARADLGPEQLLISLLPPRPSPLPFFNQCKRSTFFSFLKDLLKDLRRKSQHVLTKVVLKSFEKILEGDKQVLPADICLPHFLEEESVQDAQGTHTRYTHRIYLCRHL